MSVQLVNFKKIVKGYETPPDKDENEVQIDGDKRPSFPEGLINFLDHWITIMLKCHKTMEYRTKG